MKKLVFIFFILFQAQAFAEEVCVQIDTRDWPQEKINLMQATAYELAMREGDNNFPSRVEDRLCFQNPHFDVPAVITSERVSIVYEEGEARREAARLEEERERERSKDELSQNELSRETLETIDARIDALRDLEETKRYLKMFSRYVLANERAHE